MEKFYTVEEVANNLKVTKNTIYRWIYAGKLNSVKFGEVHRIQEQAIIDFMKSSKK